MSMKAALRGFLPDGADPCGKNTIRLSNGKSIEVDGDPISDGLQWLWKVDGQLFSIDSYAEEYFKQRLIEKLTGTRVILRAKGKVPEICGNTCRHPEHDRALCHSCPVADEACAKEDGVHLIYATLSEQELAVIQKQALSDILETIKVSVFSVSVSEENGKECGLEITGWTPHGVQMYHFIDLRDCENPYDPYALLDKFQAVVDGFDPNEEVRLHLQDPAFSKVFSCYKASIEFEEWQQDLYGLAHAVWNVENHVPGLCRGLAFANDLSYKEFLGKGKED